MLDSRLTKEELRSIVDSVRTAVRTDTSEISVLEAITAALADVDDLRFVHGCDCLSEEEIERIRKIGEVHQDCGYEYL